MPMSAASPFAPLPQPEARLCLCNVDEATQPILRDTFKQFKIQAVVAAPDVATQLRQERFDAIVVDLRRPEAEALLHAARNSRFNERTVVYAIADHPNEALRFARYAINAVMTAPVNMREARRVVSNSALLVLRQLRRFVRIPLSAAVSVTSEGRTYRGLMRELSAGGLSIHFPDGPVPAIPGGEVSFAPPGAAEIRLQGDVCWRRPQDRALGVRFDYSEPGVDRVMTWIDDYLGIDRRPRV